MYPRFPWELEANLFGSAEHMWWETVCTGEKRWRQTDTVHKRWRQTLSTRGEDRHCPQEVKTDTFHKRWRQTLSTRCEDRHCPRDVKTDTVHKYKSLSCFCNLQSKTYFKFSMPDTFKSVNEPRLKLDACISVMSIVVFLLLNNLVFPSRVQEISQTVLKYIW